MSSLGSIELDLTVPLLGGKVHGSLARAGKTSYFVIINTAKTNSFVFISDFCDKFY